MQYTSVIKDDCFALAKGIFVSVLFCIQKSCKLLECVIKLITCIDWEGCLKWRRVIDVLDYAVVQSGQGYDRVRVVQVVAIVKVLIWHGCAGKYIKCGRGLVVEGLCSVESVKK